MQSEQAAPSSAYIQIQRQIQQEIPDPNQQHQALVGLGSFSSMARSLRRANEKGRKFFVK